MRTLQRKPVYQNWKKVPGNTVPGLSYSIAELLARTVRNQPLPIMNTYLEKDDGRNSDEEIEDDINKAVSHPSFDRSADEVDYWLKMKSIDDKLEKDV